MKIISQQAGEIHAIWEIQCFIKQYNDTLLGVLGLKNPLAQDSVF